ncbi:P-loop containing nucleoside triphosphate hydrolases superfamily protein [Wolffia australiana]
MGKDKAANGGLGRALVRRHNQMVQQSKEKGAAARNLHGRHKTPIESITEVRDVDAVVELAAAGDEFEPIERTGQVLPPTAAISLDGGAATSDMLNPTEERRREREAEEALHASSLRVPRRPHWTPDMSTEQLDANESRAFLLWRRGLARLEENEKLIITPFEKNLEIWRQLWRVLERSDLLVMVVDARDPLFYRCPDLEAYAREMEESKRTLLLVNKADLLPSSIRREWAKYFHLHGILYIFWSAKAASAELEGKQEMIKEVANPSQESTDCGEDAKIYSRDELLGRLQAEAEAALSGKGSNSRSIDEHRLVNARPENKSSRHVVVGFVGYPNVGKSSTINALAGQKRAGVTSTPGKTKHFQTLIISERLMLCDCPGLVFPSFSSSRYEMIASGVLPIDRMTEHREAVQVVANHVPRRIIESVYKIKLPKPKQCESPSKPLSGQELLRAYCASRGYVISSGLPDETRAARQILKDYVHGKLPHFKLPPGTMDNDMYFSDALSCSGILEASELDSGGGSCDPSTSGPDINCSDKLLDSAIDELRSFDTSVGGSYTAAPPKKKAATDSHKHHKKPQRKKDRTWRVGNDNGDGMPIIRVFQKPPVSSGASMVGSG